MYLNTWQHISGPAQKLFQVYLFTQKWECLLSPHRFGNMLVINSDKNYMDDDDCYRCYDPSQPHTF